MKPVLRWTVYLCKRLSLSVAGLLVLAICLECGMRFLPVSISLLPQPMNAHNPVRRFAPNRNVTWSRFPDFSMRRTLRVNNYGFVNEFDYVQQDKRPLVAVVGDSYIEARQVPTGKTLHGRLAGAVSDRYRVYSFASSGTPLSGYLGYAKWLRTEFAPSKLIVVVVGNDFDECFRQYRPASTRDLFDYFAADENGKLAWFPGHFKPTLLQSMLQRSDLVMYLYNNLEIQNLGRLWNRKQQQFMGNTGATYSPERLSDSKRAVDTFLEMLPAASGLPPQEVAIVVDAMRPHVYTRSMSVDARESYFGRVREYLLKHATASGMHAIDLQEHFSEDWQENSLRFEFERDAHWNSDGHRVAASAILTSGFLDGS